MNICTLHLRTLLLDPTGRSRPHPYLDTAPFGSSPSFCNLICTPCPPFRLVLLVCLQSHFRNLFLDKRSWVGVCARVETWPLVLPGFLTYTQHAFALSDPAGFIDIVKRDIAFRNEAFQ